MTMVQVAKATLVFLLLVFHGPFAVRAGVLLLTPADMSQQQVNPTAHSQTKPFEVEVGFSYEQLNNNYVDWRGAYLHASKKFDAHTSFYGVLRHTERFKLKDQEISAGLYYPVAQEWIILVEANASPSHNILARWSLLTELQELLGDGWILHLGLRRIEFTNASTNIGMFTAERYWNRYRASYTFYLAQVVGSGLSTAHRVWVSLYYNDLSAVNLAGSIGKEVENIGPAGGVLTSDVRALTLFGTHWFASSWAMAYELLLHKQGNFYTRRGIRIGIRHLF